MGIQVEILERLKAIDALTCDTRVYSWPVTYRDGLGVYYDEYARITKCWTSNWRWGNQATFNEDKNRCQRLGVGTCLHVSPQIPIDGDWETARDDYANRWKKVADGFDLDLVEVVYVDLEGFPYAQPGKLTDETVRRNDAVRSYNLAVYSIAKQFVGDAIEVRRYSHNAVGTSRHANYGPTRAGRHTSWADPVDGGWAVDWYNLMDFEQRLVGLENTVQQGMQHGLQSGSIWIALGCSTLDWWCPGLPNPYPNVQYSKRMFTYPYDPKLSHRAGSLLANDWWRRKVHGDDYTNDTYPPMAKCHSAVIWPGVFAEEMDITAVHLVAFLEGMSIKSFDKRLQEIQVEAVEDRGVA